MQPDRWDHCGRLEDSVAKLQRQNRTLRAERDQLWARVVLLEAVAYAASRSVLCIPFHSGGAPLLAALAALTLSSNVEEESR